MQTSVTLSAYNLTQANNFLASIEDGHVYYLFAGMTNPWPGGTVEDPVNDTNDGLYSAYQNMSFGKMVTSNGIALVIPRYDYQAGVVYAQYDDQNANLFSESFYTVVNSASYSSVFKCLYNANGTPSTVQPQYTDTSSLDEYYETSDGYIWKYMYNATSAQVESLSTPAWFPVYDDANTVSNAVAGAIDIIIPTSFGAGYNNYFNGTFSSQDVKLSGNTILYNISANASGVNGYYANCFLHITAGTGAGQFSIITDYFVNATSQVVVIETPFSTAPTNGSEYAISPAVSITGDGHQTVNAYARAVINAVGNTLSSVLVLQRGAGYQYADATVAAANVVGVTDQASVRCIMGPPGGHGSDPASELGAAGVMLSVTYNGTEANTIPANNSYRQIGLIRDPLFNGCTLSFSNSVGRFLVGEQVFTINPLNLPGTVTCNGSAIVVGNGTFFTQAFESNSYVYLVDSVNMKYQCAQVAFVTNNTLMTLSTNTTLNTNIAAIAQARPNANAVQSNVVAATISSVTLGATDTNHQGGDFIIGMDSGSIATVNTVSRSGQTKSFDTFIQLVAYTGSVSGNGFIQDEVIYQTSASQANGVFHSAVGNTIYVADQLGLFTVPGTLVGSQSGTTMTVTQEYPPELVFGSGAILYLQNMDAIARSNSTQETFNLVLQG